MEFIYAHYGESINFLLIALGISVLIAAMGGIGRER